MKHYRKSAYFCIIIIHQNYEQIILEDITLGNTNQSLPQKQIPDANYYNP